MARFNQRITDALAEGRDQQFCAMIEEYQRTHDVPALRIAAALASLAQGQTPLLLAEQRDLQPRSVENVATQESDRRPPRAPDHRRTPVAPPQPQGPRFRKEPRGPARFADRKPPKHLASRRAFAQAGMNKP